MAFDAVVEVRPQLDLAGYDGLRVTVPEPEVTEEDIASPDRPAAGQLRRADRGRTARPATATTSPST